MTQVVYQNPWFEVHKQGNFHYIHEPMAKNAAVCLLFTPEHLVLLEISRIAHNGIQLEAARGYANANESPMECAQRELREETGFQLAADEFHYLGVIKPNSAILGSSITAFYAQTELTAPNQARDDEARALRYLPRRELTRLVSEGHIQCGFTLSALCYYLSQVR